MEEGASGFQRTEPDGGSAPLSVLVVHDHPMVRYGVARLLATRSDMRVTGATHRCAVALEALAVAPPDLLLLDTELKEGGASALILKISEGNLRTRVLVYSGQSHVSHVLEAMRCGAHGYLTSDAGPEDLCDALLVVAGGEFYIDPAIASKVVARMGRKHERRARVDRELTARELAVLNRLASGMRNSEIASDLYITERTVKYHITSMFNKLRAKNRAEAVKIALQNGLIR